MNLFLREPSNFRYLFLNPQTNHIHLFIPFIAGEVISTDNTCKANVELRVFFEDGAHNELKLYKETLEFHLLLLEKTHQAYALKQEQLRQINFYLEAVVSMHNTYKGIVKNILTKPSNLYSIQLRPIEQDPISHFVNPIFTINRRNNLEGLPLSPLFVTMHKVFPDVTLNKSEPRRELINKVLKVLPPDAAFETIQDELAKQYGVCNNWFKEIRNNVTGQVEILNKPKIDEIMGDENCTPIEYIEALIKCCAPNFESILEGSPFYFSNSSNKAEQLSILTQFYLGVINVYCRSKGISSENFGITLDSSSLSHELVNLIAVKLQGGEDVEPAIIEFINSHQKEFKLSRQLNEQDLKAIIAKFQSCYRTVTATNENPHMDEFMFLDTDAKGENDIFYTQKGLIGTDACHIIPETPENRAFLSEIRQEARIHQAPNTQADSTITINVTDETLRNKLGNLPMSKIPKEFHEIAMNFCSSSKSTVHEFLLMVAFGEQEKAQSCLEENSHILQLLLKAQDEFTDYSGRVFNCTAYEYAYWAKDTHMQRMLERHMDDETKELMLEKINAIEEKGLKYEQNGICYQNAHYDMSFILKSLDVNEFQQLQTILGHKIPKIQQATENNYKKTSFTATEFEQIKQLLTDAHTSFLMPTWLINLQIFSCIKSFIRLILSFFTTSPAQQINNKLANAFDFHSLITALNNYESGYDTFDEHQREEALMEVGKAQRHTPAHIAHEYFHCVQIPISDKQQLKRDYSWFPLTTNSSGLGFDIAVLRARYSEACSFTPLWINDIHSLGVFGIRPSRQSTSRLGPNLVYYTDRLIKSNDSAFVNLLDITRTNDLIQSRANLITHQPQLSLNP